MGLMDTIKGWFSKGTDTAGDMADTAGDVTGDTYDKAKDIAGDAVDEVKDKMDDDGGDEQPQQGPGGDLG